MRVRWYVWPIVVLFLLFLFLSSAILFLRNKSSSDAVTSYIPYAGTIYEQPIEHILAFTGSSNRLYMSIYAPVPSSAHTFFAHAIMLPPTHGGVSKPRSVEAMHLVKSLPDPQKQGNEESFLNKLAALPWIYLVIAFFIFVVLSPFIAKLQKNEQDIKQIKKQSSSIEEIWSKLATIQNELNETTRRLSEEIESRHEERITEIEKRLRFLYRTIQRDQLVGGLATDERNEQLERFTSSNGVSSEERPRLEQEIKQLLRNDITSIQSPTPSNPAPVDLQNQYWVTHIIPIKTIQQSQRGGSITMSQKYDPVELIYQIQRKLEYEQSTGFSVKKDGHKLKLPITSGHNYFLIVGASTAENTVLLQSLALKVLDEQVCYSILPDQQELPLNLALYINLPAYLKSTANAQVENLISYGISQLIKKTNSQETQSFAIDERGKKITAYFKDSVETGQVVLLLDGLDEFNEQPQNVSVETSERSVYYAINEVIKEHPTLPIIITTLNSPTQAVQVLKQFSPWKTTVQLCADDIRQFIEQKIPDKGNKFNLWLERSPRVQMLLTSPLLLEGVIRAHSNDEHLRAWDIYETCKKLLLQTCKNYFLELQKQPQELQSFLDCIDSRFEEAVEHLLGSIAWYLHTNNLHEGGKEGIVKAIVDKLYTREMQKGQRKTTKDMLQEQFEKEIDLFLKLVQQSGLLNEVESGFLRFSCFTWQEYFTAKSILAFDKENHTSTTDWRYENALFKHYHDPWWEEIILIYIHLTDEETSIQKLLRVLKYTPGDEYTYVPGRNYKEDNDFYTRLLFAAKAIANSKYNREQIKQDLLKQLILARYFIRQEQIIAILLDELEIGENGENIDINDVKELIKELTPELPAGLEDLSFIRLQFLPLLLSPNFDQTKRHNIAIGSQGKESNLGGLIYMLEDKSISIEIRVHLMQALAMARYTSLYEWLLMLLINGTFLNGTFHSHILPYERVEVRIRRHAALALGKLRSPTDEDLERISEYMQDDNVSQLVQYAIVDTLRERGMRGDQQVINKLQKLLDKPHNTDVRVQWRIFNVLFILVPEDFEEMSKKLRDKLQVSSDMSSDKQESHQMINLGISALEEVPGTQAFIEQRVAKVKDLVKMNRERRKEDWEEELACNIDTIRCIYGKKKDFKTRSPEQKDTEDKVEKELEQLLNDCSEVEVCNHIYETLQKIDRRIRSIRIEDFF